MGKLLITVHSCNLFPMPKEGLINPRVFISVDNTYRFHTRIKRDTLNPEYNETFVVGNTHRLATLEVCVYDVTEPTNLFRNLSPLRLYDMHAKKNVEVLIGRCYLSIRRLVQNQCKTRDYVLGTVHGISGSNNNSGVGETNNAFTLGSAVTSTSFSSQGSNACSSFALPIDGIAGTIKITLETDVLGELASAFSLNDALERHYTERIKRLLLKYDKPKLQVIDILLSNVRDTVEVHNTEDLSFIDSNAVTLTGPRVFTIAGLPQLTLEMPAQVETFDQLMQRLFNVYSSEEPEENRLLVTIEGCSMLHKRSKLKSSLLSSEIVYVLLRSDEQGYVMEPRSLKETTAWKVHNCFLFNVVNPSTFVLHVIVMRRTARHVCEIGRTTVSAAPLACNYSSKRDMFLFRLETLTTPIITGNIHLRLRPENFGCVSVKEVCHVDEFYTRLGKFMRVYDPIRIPEVDMLICCRLDHLEEFMQDLVTEHGREPGTVELAVTIKEVVALQADCCHDVHGKHVCVLVTMGELKAQTEPRSVRQFIATEFNRVVTFDVRRETDIIRMDVVHAAEPYISYGCVDFSCLNIQRGVANMRTFHLVAHAGTCEAYLSGLIRVCLFSNDIGLDYAADIAFESMFVGRLRRYMITHMPQELHRTQVIVATHFDMETYMAKLAAHYGAEEPTYAVYFTVIGCRQLRGSSMLWKINPYVVVRIGVDCFQTRVARKTKEPDYFEFCEFYLCDIEHAVLTIVVMDRTDIGHDEEIGRAEIPLCDEPLGQLHHDFVPLQSQHLNEANKNMGTVGFKFTLVDLSLVDHTRAELQRDNLRMREQHQIEHQHQHELACYTRRPLLTGISTCTTATTSPEADYYLLSNSCQATRMNSLSNRSSGNTSPGNAGRSLSRAPSQWMTSSAQVSPRASSALPTPSNRFTNRLKYLASTFGAFKRNSERFTARLARGLYLTSSSSYNNNNNNNNNSYNSNNNDRNSNMRVINYNSNDAIINNSVNDINNNSNSNNNSSSRRGKNKNAYAVTVATADNDDYDRYTSNNNMNSNSNNNKSNTMYVKNSEKRRKRNAMSGANTSKSRLAGYLRGIANVFTRSNNDSNSNNNNKNNNHSAGSSVSQSRNNSTYRSSYYNQYYSDFYQHTNDDEGNNNNDINNYSMSNRNGSGYDERDIRNLNEIDNGLASPIELNSITNINHNNSYNTIISIDNNNNNNSNISSNSTNKSITPHVIYSPECNLQRVNVEFTEVNNSLLHEPFEVSYTTPPMSSSTQRIQQQQQSVMDELLLCEDDVTPPVSESRPSSVHHSNVASYYSNLNSDNDSEYTYSVTNMPSHKSHAAAASQEGTLRNQHYFPSAAATVVINSRYARDVCNSNNTLPLLHLHTKWLRVRVLYCKNVLHRKNSRPNPYVQLATLYETHCTSTAFDTSHPEYNEEFIFKVDDVNKDALHVNVLTATPYGPRKLGSCVFSLHNIPRDNPCQRHASLVIDPHQRRATECGSIFVLLSGDGCGLDCLPSRDAENRLRERVRDLLKTSFPRQLHRLEYYVGEFCECESVILGEVFGKTVMDGAAINAA